MEALDRRYNEDFDVGVRQHAIDYQANDYDGDQRLSYQEFCALVAD